MKELPEFRMVIHIGPIRFFSEKGDIGREIGLKMCDQRTGRIVNSNQYISKEFFSKSTFEVVFDDVAREFKNYVIKELEAQ